MTLQEIFDKVATHLLKQGCQALMPSEDSFYPRCCYRDERGNKCAVGCLIKDEFFDWEFNTHPTQATRVMEALAQSLQLEDGLDGEMIVFLVELQQIHDKAPPVTWPARLTQFAEQHNLNTNALPLTGSR
jgi:hypothetical protein